MVALRREAVGQVRILLPKLRRLTNQVKSLLLMNRFLWAININGQIVSFTRRKLQVRVLHRPPFFGSVTQLVRVPV